MHGSGNVTTVPPRIPFRGSRNRSSFTLLELLLVLALIVVLFSLSIPALRRPMATQRLRKAADAVRSEWTRTRVRAMRSGRIHAFQYELNTANRYRVSPWQMDSDALEAADATQSGFRTDASPSERMYQAEFALPEGVSITSSENKDVRSFLLAQDVSGQVDRALGGQWSDPPVYFYPDGTASTSELLLRNTYGDSIRLRLRGLTGLVEVSEVEAELEVLQ
jgi:Tfp pilus assembly protein FimT